MLGLVYGANLLFFYNLAQKAVDKGIPRSHIFFRFVEQQQTTMNLIFLGTAVVIFFGTCIFGLLYSHRIAGPLYRLTQDLKGMTEGKAIRDVRFRKGDFFPEIAEAFNAFIGSRCPVDLKRDDPKREKPDARAS